jgi:hypothetical protein
MEAANYLLRSALPATLPDWETSGDVSRFYAAAVE